VAAAYLVRRRAGAGPGAEGSGDGATAHDIGA